MKKRLKQRARVIAKALYFISKGISWKTAAWLAVRDAPVATNYAGVPLEYLRSFWKAAGSWQDLSIEHGICASKALSVPFDGNPILLAGYTTFFALAKKGWRFNLLSEGVVLAECDDLRLRLCTVEECEMLKEIFLDDCYRLLLPGRWRVIDIGGNVGMAAHYFAGLPWVESVLSYEPFRPTADAFRQNLALNARCAAKISLFNKGVGARAGTMRVGYSPELRGSMSLTGVGTWRASEFAAESVETIELVAAETAVDVTLQQNDGSCLLAKIDCEGSEYAIIRRFAETGALTLFSAFLIEWHGQGPDEITHLLSSNGFAVREQPLSEDRKLLGLIYAVRLPSS
jgi:FkbM family methyltransferase